MRNEGDGITPDIIEIHMVMINNYEKLYAKKFEYLVEIDKFRAPYHPPKLNQEEAESLNRPITASEIETVMGKFPTPKRPGPDGFT